MTASAAEERPSTLLYLNALTILMMEKPSATLIGGCALLSGAAMVAALYFAGTGRLPLAMIGATLFVLLGGVAFELARRRSS